MGRNIIKFIALEISRSFLILIATFLVDALLVSAPCLLGPNWCLLRVHLVFIYNNFLLTAAWKAWHAIDDLAVHNLGLFWLN